MTGEAASCAVLPWDSQFFGHKIARLAGSRLTREALEGANAFCAREQVECLYFLAASDDAATVALAEDAGFRLVDVRVTLAREAREEDTGSAVVSTAEPVIRSATPNDREALARLAERSHLDTRFFADARLAPRAPALYARWIERGLEDARGAVFVVDVGGTAVGYLTCSLAAGEGNIGLVAVSEQVQRRGVGGRLVAEGLAWLARAGAVHTTVVTQGRNVPAQNLYQRAGFATRAVELWFHKWFRGP